MLFEDDGKNDKIDANLTIYSRLVTTLDAVKNQLTTQNVNHNLRV